MARYIFGSWLLSLFFFATTEAVQIISQPGIEVELATPSGSTKNPNGVEFTNQVVGNSATLLVPGGYTINSNGNPDAISTTVPSTGIVQFKGANNRGASNVSGKIGDVSSYLESIIIMDNDVNIQNRTYVDSFIFNGTGTANFNGNLFVGSGGVLFNNPAGIVNLNKNVTVTGSINGNLSAGYLFANTETVVNGDVAVFQLKFTNNDKVGPPKQIVINGNLTAQNIRTENGAVQASGNLHLGAGAVIDFDKGQSVGAGGTLQLDGFVELRVSYSPLEAPRSPNDQFVVVGAAGGGTSGETITVRTNDVRVQLVGSNATPGIITIQGVNVGNPPTLPGDPETNSPWWVNLVPSAGGSTEAMVTAMPIAYAFPGSDLDFIEGQIGSPTLQGYLDNLYQLYPAPALIGVARETFNTTKQFQKVWLKQLERNRSSCLFKNRCRPCPDQSVPKEGIKIWADGFGYFGRQSNKVAGQGYRVNTWGTTVAAECPIKCNLRAGIGFGYGYTDINKSQFTIKTPRTNNTVFNAYQATVYGSYSNARWFVDGGFAFGWNYYDGTRYIYLPNTNRIASSNYFGTLYTGYAVMGYHYFCNKYEITPFISLMNSYLYQHKFHESGADTLNLKVKAQNYQFLQSGLGFKVARLIDTCLGSYIPEVRFIWLHDYINTAARATASFSGLAAGAGYFRNVGPTPDWNTWNIGAAVTCFSNCNFSILLDYDFEWSNRYKDHQGLVQFSYVY